MQSKIAKHNVTVEHSIIFFNTKPYYRFKELLAVAIGIYDDSVYGWFGVEGIW